MESVLRNLCCGTVVVESSLLNSCCGVCVVLVVEYVLRGICFGIFVVGFVL